MTTHVLELLEELLIMHVKCVTYNNRPMSGIYFVVAFIAVIFKIALSVHSRWHYVQQWENKLYPSESPVPCFLCTIDFGKITLNYSSQCDTEGVFRQGSRPTQKVP